MILEDELKLITVPKPLEPFVGQYYKALCKRADKDLLSISEFLCFKRFIDMYNSGEYVFAERAMTMLFKFLGLLIFIDEDGKPHRLELYPAQKFVMVGIFGLRHKDGSYLVNVADVFMARRNGKSFLMSGLLHALMGMSKFKGENLILASCKGQSAQICFNEFTKFISNDPYLKEQYENVNQTACWAKHKYSKNKLVLFRTGGQAKKQLDGHTNKVCLIDEWALVDPIVTKTLQDGQAAFRDSLIVKISTAQYDVGSNNHKYWIASRKALHEGTLPDNVFLFLCEPDEEDIASKNFASMKVWGKANPVLLFEKDGYTLKEHIRTKYAQKAKEAMNAKGFDLQTFATKQCNIWYCAEDRALCNYDQLQSCGVEYSFEDCVKAGYRDFYIGIDSAQCLDLASVNFQTWVFENENGNLVPRGESYVRKRLFHHTLSWMPKNRLTKHVEKDNFCYYDYVDKELFLCDSAGGENIDTNQIYEKIEQIRTEYDLNIVTVSVDPYNISNIQEKLDDMAENGLILQNQSPKALSEHIEHYSQYLKDGIIAYQKGREDIWEKAITNSILVRNSTGFYSVEKISLNASSPIRIDPLDASITNFVAVYIDETRGGAETEETLDEWFKYMK